MGKAISSDNDLIAIVFFGTVSDTCTKCIIKLVTGFCNNYNG